MRRGSTTEVLNRGLDTSVIDTNNVCRNREVGRGEGEGLSMVATYYHLDNALGLHMTYLQVL